jgi:transcriptional regulator
MHPNKTFRETDTARNLAFARERGFGMLTIAGGAGLLVSHVPFIISEDGKRVELHLAKPNPILKELAAPVPCILAVTGPDGYVSPDWYELDNNQVPTWNYVAVHIRGMLRLSPQEEITGVLERLSANFEARLAPKAPWTPAKMEPAVFERMQRAISPLSIAVETIEATWKLGQNKPEAARRNAANAMRASTVGSHTAELSRLMVVV